jgi:antitoxin HigA-1
MKGQHSIRIHSQWRTRFRWSAAGVARCWNRGLPLRIYVNENENLPNIHPGEILLEEFLLPMNVSQNALARATGVPPRRINEIALGKRGVTADTALRLAVAFGTSEGFWLGLQADYDLAEARAAIKGQLKDIERIAA